MNSEILTVQQAAVLLSCSERTVRAMLRDGLLDGRKVQGKWQITKSSLSKSRANEDTGIGVGTSSFLQPKNESYEDSDLVTIVKPVISSTIPPTVDESGLIEVSIALAGIATAVAAFLPEVSGTRTVFAFMATIVAVFSTYAALWLMARNQLKRDSFGGFLVILSFLLSPAFGPYWLLEVGLFFLLLIAASLFALTFLN